MPKVKISEYSATANSNTDVASINIDEGCAPSGINNAIRAVMGHLKDFQSGTSNDPFTVGSSGSLTLSYGTANGVAYLNGSKVVTSGSALVFDGTNLGIGNTTPTSYNSAADNLVIGTSGNNGMTIVSGSTSSGYIMFADGTTGQQAYEGQITYDHTNNFMAFNTSGTERMRIASDTGGVGAVGIGYTSLTSVGNNGLAVLGNVGIGTSSPSTKLDVVGVVKATGSGPSLISTEGSGQLYAAVQLQATSSGGKNWSLVSNATSSPLGAAGSLSFRDSSVGTTHMTLDASGNLGVGTTAPLGLLNIKGSNGQLVLNNGASSGGMRLSAFTNAGTANGYLAFEGYNAEYGRFDASGNLLVGLTSALGSQLGVQAAGGNGTSFTLRHTSATAGKYRLAGIDSSNNYLIYNDSNVGMYMTDGGTSWTATSDETQKILTSEFSNAAIFISTVRATRGRYKTDDESTSRSFLIAQDWQDYLPEAISEKDGILGLSYQDTIPVLVKAIQELTARITALEGA